MHWTVSPDFLAEVLIVLVVVAFLPSSIATVATVHDRRIGRARTPVRVLTAASYALCAAVVVAVVLFLLLNRVRVVPLIFT